MGTGNKAANHSEWLAKLFSAVAAEWAGLATAIGALGDSLPTEVIISVQPEAMEKLQQFDALRQNAQAQSQLLEALSGEICSNVVHDFEQTRALIDKIPFADMRGRLKVALHEAGEHELHDHSDDGVVAWL